MKSKRGQTRIIEAAIAIMLLLGFVIFTQPAPSSDVSNSVYKIQHEVLVEIGGNESLRESISGGDVSSSANYAKSRLSPYGLEIEMSLCSISESCVCRNCPSGKSIYGDSIIISGSLPSYSPGKLSMFVWS